MKKIIILTFAWLLCLSAVVQDALPDLTNPANLPLLGAGRIIEKDNSIIKRITLKEIKAYWVVYLKDESLHDKPMEYIRRIEFPDSKWGRIKVEFPGNKPTVSFLSY